MFCAVRAVLIWQILSVKTEHPGFPSIEIKSL